MDINLSLIPVSECLALFSIDAFIVATAFRPTDYLMTAFVTSFTARSTICVWHLNLGTMKGSASKANSMAYHYIGTLIVSFRIGMSSGCPCVGLTIVYCD